MTLFMLSMLITTSPAMFPLEEKLANSSRSSYQHRHSPTILYNILSWRYSDRHNKTSIFNASAHNCHCEQRRTVCLRDPEATYHVASSVLVKTICFMRHLPSFSQLPMGDQLSLLRHCWVSLFVLGLAQEKIVFEVTDSSILRQILLGPGLPEKDADQPTDGEVHRLRTCLLHLWNLDLCPKEYAYLKGAMLFNPGKISLYLLCFHSHRELVMSLNRNLLSLTAAGPALTALSLIEDLQQESQRALQEVTRLLHPGDAGRFSQILLAASTIQTVSHSLATELFFKPVIGNIDMLHLLTEMLFVQ